jgi:hypothetical protein
METLILIFVGFVAWLYLAKFINDNYQQSRGWSALFWFILLIGTVSFLFGSSGSSPNSSGGGDANYNNDYDNNDEGDYCTKSFWDNDSSCDSSWGNSDDE